MPVQAKVTYVHHNCFVLDLDGRVLVFDYPASRLLPSGAADMVRELIRDREAYVFISHSHDDHFDFDIFSFPEIARSVRYVLSDDLPSFYPDYDFGDALIVEPDETYALDPMTISTLESTDLGVAFLIDTGAAAVYHGGDLANWNFDDLDENTRDFSQRSFDAALRFLRGRRIDLAFSNTDNRLASWAGGLQFVREVRPDWFVPMHTFGRTEWTSEFVLALGPTATHIFAYEKPGDTISLELAPGSRFP